MLRSIEEEGTKTCSAGVTVSVPTAVALYILNQKRFALSQIEMRHGFRIYINGDDTLTPPDYRLERIKQLAPGEELPPAIAPAPMPTDVELEIDADIPDEVEEEVETAEGEAETQTGEREGAQSEAGGDEEGGPRSRPPSAPPSRTRQPIQRRRVHRIQRGRGSGARAGHRRDRRCRCRIARRGEPRRG